MQLVFFPFILASFVLAAPRSSCLSSAIVDVPPNSTLTLPTKPVSFFTLGVGTQNYTCSDAGTFTSVGALVSVFDASHLLGTQAFSQVPSRVLKSFEADNSTILSIVKRDPAFTNPTVLGEHFFITNPANASDISPVWDFRASAFRGNANAFVLAAQVADIPAPTGPQDVDWVLLRNVSGGLADEVYRTDTRGGQPPSKCTPGSDPITVKFTCYYWLTGSSVVKK